MKITINNINTAPILISLGFEVDKDFSAQQASATSCEVEWFSAATMPTEAEINAAEASMASNLLAIQHPKLVALLSGDGPPYTKIVRALLLTALDEFNAHAAKMNAILTAIDNGSTLAQVKTNIAAIADYPTRTKANLITTMTNKINAGDADS